MSEYKIIFDDTPVHIRRYWIDQNPEYIKTLEDPDFLIEQNSIVSDMNQEWRKKLYQLDPSHPRAMIPAWVRFAKRKKQGFRCYVLGWHEQDWMLNKQSGEIRQVGILTVDHTLAGANGGLTTDQNTMMIASIVNSKKGRKQKTYEEMREHLHSIYELYDMTSEQLEQLDRLKSSGIKKIML